MCGREYILREAERDDIPVLIELRLAYLRENRGALTMQEETALRTVLTEYFTRNIGSMFFACLLEVGGEPVSAAYLAISEKPANPAFITGKIGTILNVYTKAEYRRRGYATRVLEELIKRAKKENLSKVELSATADGKPVYEKIGFQEKNSKYTAMQLRLQ